MDDIKSIEDLNKNLFFDLTYTDYNIDLNLWMYKLLNALNAHTINLDDLDDINIRKIASVLREKNIDLKFFTKLENLKNITNYKISLTINNELILTLKDVNIEKKYTNFNYFIFNNGDTINIYDDETNNLMINEASDKLKKENNIFKERYEKRYNTFLYTEHKSILFFNITKNNKDNLYYFKNICNTKINEINKTFNDKMFCINIENKYDLINIYYNGKLLKKIEITCKGKIIELIINENKIYNNNIILNDGSELTIIEPLHADYNKYNIEINDKKYKSIILNPIDNSSY